MGLPLVDCDIFYLLVGECFGSASLLLCIGTDREQPINANKIKEG